MSEKSIAGVFFFFFAAACSSSKSTRACDSSTRACDSPSLKIILLTFDLRLFSSRTEAVDDDEEEGVIVNSDEL